MSGAAGSTRCAFDADAHDAQKKTCANCGRVLRSPHPPQRCHAVCRASASRDAANNAPRRKSLALQFLRAWWRYLRAGSPRATDASERLAICATCPHHRPQGVLSTCAACGCFVRLKARWATESCPRGKWPGDPPAPEKKCGCGG